MTITQQQATNAPFTEEIGGRSFIFSGLTFRDLAALDDVARQQLLRPARREAQSCIREAEQRCAEIRSRYANDDGTIDKEIQKTVGDMMVVERDSAKSTAELLLQTATRESASITLTASGEVDEQDRATDRALRSISLTSSPESVAAAVLHSIRHKQPNASIEDAYFILSNVDADTQLIQRITALTSNPTTAAERQSEATKK